VSKEKNREAPAASDEALVNRQRAALPGDTRPFAELVRRHQERILANCRYLTGSPDDAEDLAQDVFIKAFFALGRFEGRARFGTWLQRIKVNHCLNHLRRRRRWREEDVDDAALQARPELKVDADAEARLADTDRRRRIAAVLDAMPETLRVPLLLRDLDGLEYAEIAERLGIGLSAVKMRIKRGREMFRRLYDAG